MNYVENITKRFPELSNLADKINGAINILIDCYRGGGKILLCGNGGSCADSEHISGELLKGFLSLRHPTPEELDALSESLESVRVLLVS